MGFRLSWLYPFRALRDLPRYRKSVIDDRARESQRLHKVLEDAGVKLSSATSSVLTKSGREMIDALIDGQRDPEALAEMAEGPRGWRYGPER